MALVQTDAPAKTRYINTRTWVRDAGAEQEVWVNYALFFRYDKGDQVAERLAIASLARLPGMKKVKVAEAFACHRNTVGRLEAALEKGGAGAMLAEKAGPKGPWKLDGALRGRVRQLHRQGLKVGQMVGRLKQERGIRVSRRSVARIVEQEEARRSDNGMQGSLGHSGPGMASLFSQQSVALSSEGTVVQEPGAGVGELAPAWDEVSAVLAAELVERSEAAGTSREPQPVIREKRSLAAAGAFLFYPALAAVGLLDAFRRVYRPLVARRYGLRELVLTLFFLWVLGFRSVEAFKGAARREVGYLIGALGTPTVKTLHRKLTRLAQLRRGAQLLLELARGFADAGVVQVGVLYVDGHLKPYYGSRALGEVWSPQRRMPVPGIQQYFVNDAQGRPLFFLTAQPQKSLTQMLPHLVEEIRAVIGQRPLTLVFDRAGYSPKLFRGLLQQGVHIITYRRKPFEPYPEADFQEEACQFQGRQREYQIREDTVRLKGAGFLRNIAVLRRKGGQTHILTTDWETAGVRIACLMINRWRQENFFKYMLEHYALDNLQGYGEDSLPAEALVTNPQRRATDQELGQVKAQAKRVQGRLGALVARGARPQELQQLRQELAELDERAAALRQRRKQEPKKLPVSQTDSQVEVLDLEKKILADTIKTAAYNAEAWLLERLDRHYDDPRDIRQLLRTFVRLKGRLQLRSDQLVVDLEPPDVPKHRRALEGLCAELNALALAIPESSYSLAFTVAGREVHHKPYHPVGPMS